MVKPTAEDNAIDLANYALVASAAILYYDYAVTLPSEIAHVWPRLRAPGAIWFLLNRYLSLFGTAASLAVAWAAQSVEDCKRYSFAHQLLLTAAQLLVMVLLFMRTYALYERSRKILFLLSGTVVALAGASFWTLGGQKNVPIITPGRGCHLDMSYSTAVRISLIWWAQLAFDSLVFGLTLARTWRARLPLVPGARERDLLYVLRRDGALYFGVMVLANFAVIISLYTFHSFARGCLASIASATSVTLMSRLLLNLHRAASHNTTFTARSSARRRLGSSDAWGSDATTADDAGMLSTRIDTVEGMEPKDWWAGDFDDGPSEDAQDGRAVPPEAGELDVELDAVDKQHARERRVGFTDEQR